MNFSNFTQAFVIHGFPPGFIISLLQALVLIYHSEAILYIEDSDCGLGPSSVMLELAKLGEEHQPYTGNRL